jgi:hypothetical protein
MSKLIGRSVIGFCLCATLALTGCDRGASDQIAVARRFTDAVVRGNAVSRDSLIATAKLKEFFANTYVASDMQSWLKSLYDTREQKFIGIPSADVDRNLEPQLKGALLDTNQIEETGMVKVKSPNAGEDAAFFWMVKQHGARWHVAMVTKGETQVNFQ